MYFFGLQSFKQFSKYSCGPHSKSTRAACGLKQVCLVPFFAIKQLKGNKSTGSDGLAAELFKMGPERLTVEIS